MNKYSLSFKDKSLERLYILENKNMRILSLITFIKIELSFCIIIAGYASISNSNFFLLLEILLSIILLPIVALIKKYIPKILEAVMTLLYLGFGVLFIELLKNSKIGRCFNEQSIALIIPFQLLQSTLLLTKVKWIYCSLYYLLGIIYLIVRVYDFSFYDGKDVAFLGIGLSFLSFCYMSYKQEKTNREYYKSISDSNKSLNNFKILLQNIIPNPIFIIDYQKNRMEFINKSAVKILKRNNLMIDCDEELLNFKISNKNNELLFQKYEEFLEGFQLLVNKKSNLISPLSRMDNLKYLIKNFSDKISNSGTNNCFEEIEFLSFNLTRNDLENEDDEELLQKNEIKIYYELKIAKIDWEDKKSLLVLLTDTTSMKRIAELKNIDQYKTRLLATVSHDLRTPLNGIIGIIDLSMMQIKEKELIDNLSIALNSANLLLYMINDILDFSQISYKKIRLNFEQININELIKEIFNLFDFQIKKKSIEFIYEINVHSNFQFISDGNRIKQILLNLLSNALKFTKIGYIKLKVEEQIRLNHEFICRFSVEDTGIGIKEENQNKLFQLFSKLDQEDPEINRTGIGLGLTISQSLSKLLYKNSLGENNGGISVKSIYGKGSLFYFDVISKLELKEENINNDTDENIDKIEVNVGAIDRMDKFHSLKNSTLCSDYLLLNQNSKTILIIDDDLMNLVIAQKYMEFFKLHYLTATNGLEGFQIIENQVNENKFNVDLILMDCNMPVLDGFRATEKILDFLNLKRLNKIPIIGFTANVTLSDREKCFSVGMKNVLNKPVKRTDLAKLINEELKINLPT